MNRRHALGGTLGATLLLVAIVGAQDEPAGEPAAVAAVERPRAVPATAGAAPPASAHEATRRAPWPEPAASSLAAWSPPPPPAAPPAPPAAPEPAAPPAPPPFPYQWIGLLLDGGEPQALLAGELRTIGARRGDVIDGTWRVDAVGEARIDITWLPAKQPITLALR